MDQFHGMPKERCGVELKLCCLEALKSTEPMGPKTFTDTGPQTVLKFLITRIEQYSIIPRLPADDVRME